MGVLELAARMLPDVVFLISDACIQWKETGSLSDVPCKSSRRSSNAFKKVLKHVVTHLSLRDSGDQKVFAWVLSEASEFT